MDTRPWYWLVDWGLNRMRKADLILLIDQVPDEFAPAWAAESNSHRIAWLREARENYREASYGRQVQTTGTVRRKTGNGATAAGGNAWLQSLGWVRPGSEPPFAAKDFQPGPGGGQDGPQAEGQARQEGSEPSPLG